jgi:hypothetical protein
MSFFDDTATTVARSVVDNTVSTIMGALPKGEKAEEVGNALGTKLDAIVQREFLPALFFSKSGKKGEASKESKGVSQLEQVYNDAINAIPTKVTVKGVTISLRSAVKSSFTFSEFEAIVNQSLLPVAREAAKKPIATIKFRVAALTIGSFVVGGLAGYGICYFVHKRSKI